MIYILWCLIWVLDSLQDYTRFHLMWNRTNWWDGKYTNKLKGVIPFAMFWDGWHFTKWVKYGIIFILFTQSPGYFSWNFALFFALIAFFTKLLVYHVVLPLIWKPDY